MGVADWRAWTNQNGGTLPTAPNPPGTPWQTNMPFGSDATHPGIQPITDLINGASSFPVYPNTPTYVPAVDPFGGWTDLKELAPTYQMRPIVAGITS